MQPVINSLKSVKKYSGVATVFRDQMVDILTCESFIVLDPITNNN